MAILLRVVPVECVEPPGVGRKEALERLVILGRKGREREACERGGRGGRSVDEGGEAEELRYRCEVVSSRL